jgi:hypothetical protein
MSADQGSTSTGSSRKRTMLYAAVLTFTVVISSGATVFGYQTLTEPRPPAKTLDAIKLAADGSTPAANQAVDSTRLVVSKAQELLDTRRSRSLRPGAEVTLKLPSISPDSTAVLLDLSVLDAAGPGPVTVQSSVDEVPALRVPAKEAATSATVVTLLGPDHSLRVRTDGGGHLLVNLMGVFEPADTATGGRVVPVTPERVLRLAPDVDGNDADLNIADMKALRDAESVSAVLLHVAGDVGSKGGHIYLGPSADSLDQRVLWGATSGPDRTRHGFILVPVPKGQFHLRYHAGTELRVELVGYVTGEQADEAGTGLVVPLPYQAAGAVRVATDGRTEVPVVPPTGLAGVAPDRVAAAFFSLTADSDTRGDITVTSPRRKAGYPILSVAPGKPRSAVTLSRVEAGTVAVAGEAGVEVILTPRALVLGD